MSKLRDRAEMFKKTRAFFDERGVVEVDCPIISRYASVDAHIDLIPCQVASGETRFLHSSPEYGMKRLLAEGMGDIFQLSHVFRDGESGARHNPEFTMIEWYRRGFSYEQMIEETCQVIELFVQKRERRVVTYQEAFRQHTGIDPFCCSTEDLLAYTEQQGMRCPYDPAVDTLDDLLSFIVATWIEPRFDKELLTVLSYFPASQAALAKTRLHNGVVVAERFEVFHQGMELANGYHELQDAAEQRRRFHEANRERTKRGKRELPVDEHFLQALEKGFPDCCGVAVGFDRLMMLRHGVQDIGAVIPFGWELV